MSLSSEVSFSLLHCPQGEREGGDAAVELLLCWHSSLLLEDDSFPLSAFSAGTEQLKDEEKLLRS